MEIEKSIRRLDEYVGKKVQILAFGTAYLGVLQKIDYDKGFLEIKSGKQKLVLDLERVESFAGVEEQD